jgi:hypothetical protein
MGKIVPVFNYAPHHKDMWGSEGTAQNILNLGTKRSKWSASHLITTAPGERTPVPNGQEGG